MAEGVGFEPTVGIHPQRFSRPSHSAALAPFRLATLSVGSSRSFRWRVAEGVGFEPTEACASRAFQARRFGRSRTPPNLHCVALQHVNEGRLSEHDR